MSNEVTVYTRMISSTTMLCDVIKKEIGVKHTCLPFAIRAMEALSGLTAYDPATKKNRKLNETEGRIAANTFLDNLQTLIMGGTTTEDYDKIDIVKRGSTVTLSLRVEGLIRAAARKGYRIIPTFVAVPKDCNIYFEEVMQSGEICYLLRDDHKVRDRSITAERLISDYFDRFICRLEIRAVNNNARVAMTVVEMSTAEVMAVHNASDNGIYKSKWVYDEQTKKRNKVIFNGENGNAKELNQDSFWMKWTSEMVYKTVLRRAIKKVRDALPELANTFYSFDEQSDEVIDIPQKENIIMPQVDIKSQNIDLANLNDEQKKEADEVMAIYKANPQMAVQEANAIMHDFLENGKTAQELVNDKYAEISVLMQGKTREIIQPLLDEIGGAK